MFEALAARRTSVKTSGSSGPSSAFDPPPAGAPPGKLKAILRCSKSAETFGDDAPKGELVLEALSDGELGGVRVKERRWSACGLRLNCCRVRARILTRLLPGQRRREQEQRKVQGRK